MRTLDQAVLLACASLASGANAADILVTGFDAYSTGNLSGQVAWTQPVPGSQESIVQE